MSQSFWHQLETLAASTAETVVPALLNVYLNQAVGVPGTPAMTLGNIGRIAGVVAATSVLQHLGAVQAPAAAAPAQTAA